MDFLNSENSSKLSRGTSAYTSILLIWEEMSTQCMQKVKTALSRTLSKFEIRIYQHPESMKTFFHIVDDTEQVGLTRDYFKCGGNRRYAGAKVLYSCEAPSNWRKVVDPYTVRKTLHAFFKQGGCPLHASENALKYYADWQEAHQAEVATLLRKHKYAARLDPDSADKDQLKLLRQIKNDYKEQLSLGRYTTP